MRFDLDDIWLNAMNGLDHVLLQNKRRLYRITMVSMVGLCYLLDTILLSLFALAGTIHTDAPLFFGFAGLVHVLLFSLLHWTGFSERFKNNHMTIWQMAYGISAQLMGILLAPQITFYFLALMFVIFAFGTLRISFREALSTWLLSCIAIYLTILLKEDSRLVLQNASSAEYLLVSVSFSLILLRAIALGYYASTLRVRMYDLSRSFKKDATHDELTGIHNRRGLLDILEEQLSQCLRKGTCCSLALIDIDHFKQINDNFGHAVGDEILRAFTKRLKEEIRVSDKLGRYGGEEFILVMAATSLDGAESLAQRIRLNVSQMQWEALPDGYPVTISIGITELMPQDQIKELMPQDQINGAIKRADAALYEAKRAGRNRVVLNSGEPGADIASDLIQ